MSFIIQWHIAVPEDNTTANHVQHQRFVVLPAIFAPFSTSPGQNAWSRFLDEAFNPQGGAAPKPVASRSAVSALKTIVVNEDPELNEPEPAAAEPCVVCQDQFESGQSATVMPCRHRFHSDCLSPWLKENNSCPTCRYELATDDAQYNAALALRQADRNQALGVVQAVPQDQAQVQAQTPAEAQNQTADLQMVSPPQQPQGDAEPQAQRAAQPDTLTPGHASPAIASPVPLPLAASTEATANSMPPSASPDSTPGSGSAPTVAVAAAASDRAVADLVRAAALWHFVMGSAALLARAQHQTQPQPQPQSQTAQRQHQPEAPLRRDSNPGSGLHTQTQASRDPAQGEAQETQAQAHVVTMDLSSDEPSAATQPMDPTSAPPAKAQAQARARASQIEGFFQRKRKTATAASSTSEAGAGAGSGPGSGAGSEAKRSRTQLDGFFRRKH